MNIHNPYWEAVQSFPPDEITWKYRHKWEPQWSEVPWRELPYMSPDLRDKIKHRDDLCIQYSWSIPDPISLEFVAKHLGRSAIEIGAGSGYYAYCLAQLGTHVVCYDAAPPQRVTNNHWHSPRLGRYEKLSGQLRPVWQEIYWGNHNKAAQYDYPLFLCWPPYEDSMAAKTLKAYRGNKLVYIGEGDGGCTADESFFMLLNKHWECIDSHEPIQWSGIHDIIEVYERKQGGHQP